jgi:uncharacterized protein YoxC
MEGEPGMKQKHLCYIRDTSIAVVLLFFIVFTVVTVQNTVRAAGGVKGIVVSVGKEVVGIMRQIEEETKDTKK